MFAVYIPVTEMCLYEAMVTPTIPGKHAEDDGSHHCTNCKAGYFADEEGSAMCQPCEPGTFAYQTGQESCTDCPAGRFAPGNGEFSLHRTIEHEVFDCRLNKPPC